MEIDFLIQYKKFVVYVLYTNRINDNDDCLKFRKIVLILSFKFANDCRYCIFINTINNIKNNFFDLQIVNIIRSKQKRIIYKLIKIHYNNKIVVDKIEYCKRLYCI